MKKMHLTDRYALINLDSISFEHFSQILEAKGFLSVLKDYIKTLKRENNVLIDTFKAISVDNLVDFYKLLLVYDLNDAIKNNPKITHKHIKDLLLFTEGLYDYWRSIERFGILKGSRSYDPQLKMTDFISANDRFNDTIINLYRTVTQKLYKRNYNVYRQLPAGINANMLYFKHSFTQNRKYRSIQNVPFITKVIINPPFIIKSKSNTRSGVFQEVNKNPLESLSINKNHFLVFPVKVGKLLAFVYTHRDFLHQAIAMSNLFELANYEDYKEKEPDLIYIYGIKETEYDGTYFFDHADNQIIGFVSKVDKNDYFGYLKKMLLTLHNVFMINQNKLPIHGAMVKIVLKNNTSKTIAIVGDSGAGKSETLEALRIIGKNKIRDLKIIFDDMGVFSIDNEVVHASGTEIGAFVRLDDLETGYAYQVMDRALFLNPNQSNSRLVIPVSTYDFIIEKHPVDLLLYANNYESTKSGIRLFDNTPEAISVFKEGKRMSKGTTSEKGLVTSYFANPFGPLQERVKVDDMLVNYFETLKKHGTKIGELYTKLAIVGEEMTGPQQAAEALLDYLNSK